MSQAYDDRRQAIYWRLLTTVFALNEQGANFDTMAQEVVQELELPELLLEPRLSVNALIQRYPELAADFQQHFLSDAPMAINTPEDEAKSLRRSLIFSKLLLNSFGPNTQTNTVSAQQYSQWLQDVGDFERACGFAPGGLRGQKGGKANQGAGTGPSGAGGTQTGSGGGGGTQTGSGGGDGGTGTGSGGRLISEEELRAGLKEMEGDLIKRMALREVLQDDKLASKLTPSMPLVEQLLRDKADLSGNALKNAKWLIQQLIDEMAQVLRLQVEQSIGKIDRSVPPKRVYRNLDLKRTIWKNLTNWNPEEKRLYVDRLYYRQASKKRNPTRMIVVVDQSGSMVDAMVQCTILASIFAGLPNVEVHLLAFDTEVIDLTPWVHDPFEVLLRTQLGGGTHIYKALVVAAEKILEPKNTALVLISDFYEGGSDQILFDYIKSLKNSGLHFIPVGAVTSSGYFTVHDWFRTRLKEIGCPILTGSPKKLIDELKKFLPA